MTPPSLHPLSADLAAFLARHLSADTPLVIAVSGGTDSLALLHAACAVWPRARLIAAHLDHQLRPDSADHAAQVAAWATAWGVTYRGESADVAAFARQSGQSLEMAARQARYAFLARVARQHHAPAILTAHHADDQTETILLHLLRGSGLAGLRGMAEATPLPHHPDVQLLRPWLGVSRADLEGYCAAAQLTPLEDGSNRDKRFLRNRLRHEVVPLLEGVVADLGQKIGRLSTIARADDDLLAELTESVWQQISRTTHPHRLEWALAPWRALPVALQRRLLVRAGQQLGSAGGGVAFEPLEAARLLALHGQTGQQADLPGGWFLRVQRDALWLARSGVLQTDGVPQLAVGAQQLPLPVAGSVPLANGWRLEALLCAGSDRPIGLADGKWQVVVVVPDGVPLLVRGRLVGERVQPPGLGGHATALKKVWQAAGVPADWRDRWPIVATPDHAVWVVGQLVDRRAQVGEGVAIRLTARREIDN